MQLTYGNEICINRYHYFSGVPWTTEYLNGICKFLWDWWNAELRADMPTTCRLDIVTGVDLSSPTGSIGQYIAPAGPIAGTWTTAQLPNNVTLAVKWTTETRGRSARGRTFHVGIPEDAVVQNTAVPGFVATMLEAYGKLIDDPGLVEVTQFCVLSEVTAGAPRAEGVTFPITAVSVDNTVDTQRRRLPR